MSKFEELENQEEMQCRKLRLKILEELARGRKVKILDALPEDFGKHLGDTFLKWSPPGTPKIAESHPIHNLASILTTPPVPKKVLVVISSEPDKTTFKYKYGLSEQLGIRYEQFLDLIAEGRIVISLDRIITKYTADFYDEIFAACARAGYVPRFISYQFGSILRSYRLTSIARELQIPPSKDWADLVLKKCPEYDLGEITQDVTKLFGEDCLDSLSREHLETPDHLVGVISSSIHDLRVFGFERVTKKAVELAQKDARSSFYALTDYANYLIDPFLAGAFGEHPYDVMDVERMAFLRVIPHDLEVIWEDILYASPASMRLSCDPFDVNIVVKPDTTEVERFTQKDEDDELGKKSSSYQEAANQYDFDGIIKNYEEISEIVQERVNKEHKTWFKRSKTVKASLYLGVGLTALLGTSTGLEKLHSLLKDVPYLYPLLPIGMERLIKAMKIGFEKTTAYLVDNWPFNEKGFPYLLYRYGIKPEQ